MGIYVYMAHHHIDHIKIKYFPKEVMFIESIRTMIVDMRNSATLISVDKFISFHNFRAVTIDGWIELNSNDLDN